MRISFVNITRLYSIMILLSSICFADLNESSMVKIEIAENENKNEICPITDDLLKDILNKIISNAENEKIEKLIKRNQIYLNTMMINEWDYEGEVHFKSTNTFETMESIYLEFNENRNNKKNKIIELIAQAKIEKVKIEPDFLRIPRNVLMAFPKDKDEKATHEEQRAFMEDQLEVLKHFPKRTNILFDNTIDKKILLDLEEEFNIDVSEFENRAKKYRNLNIETLKSGVLGRKMWPQDYGEFAYENGKRVLLTSAYVRFNSQDNSLPFKQVETPVIFDGGDISVSQSHVFVGDLAFKLTTVLYKYLGLDYDFESIKNVFRTTFDKEPIILTTNYTKPTFIYHLDLYLIPIANNKVIMLDYEYDRNAIIEQYMPLLKAELESLRQNYCTDTSSWENEMEWVIRSFQKKVFNTVDDMRLLEHTLKEFYIKVQGSGYEVVKIKQSFSSLFERKSYLNGVIYSLPKLKTLKTQFIMPYYERMENALDVKDQLETKAGLEIHLSKVKEMHNKNAGLHCATNIF
ncbi:MAG: hypothetical protein ABIA04_12330 [Pseudomonadota bacterium]